MLLLKLLLTEVIYSTLKKIIKLKIESLLAIEHGNYTACNY